MFLTLSEERRRSKLQKYKDYRYLKYKVLFHMYNTLRSLSEFRCLLMKGYKEVRDEKGSGTRSRRLGLGPGETELDSG